MRPETVVNGDECQTRTERGREDRAQRCDESSCADYIKGENRVVSVIKNLVGFEERCQSQHDLYQESQHLS